MKKILTIFILLCFSVYFINDKEVEAKEYNNDYGSHLDTPFDMKHHITTYLDTNTGYLYIAGDNRYYNLGTGTTTSASLYFSSYKNGVVENKFINPIDWDFEIYHAAIVDNDGSLWTSGYNSRSGMLGEGTPTYHKYFTQINTPNDLKVKKVLASRGYATFVLLEDDSFWGIGSSTSVGVSGSSTWKQLDILLPEDDNKVVDFQGGEEATLILTEKGNLYSVGTSNVAGGSSSWTTPKLTNVTQIDLMYTSSFALKNDGTVWSTGQNSGGQLGHGNTSAKSIFTQVNLQLDNEFPVLVKAGIYTSVLLTNKGNLYFCGRDSDGQFGDGTTNSSCTTFKLVHTDVAYFDVGEYQTGVLFKDSSLKFFGQNDFGQLGIGTTTDVHDALSDEAKLVSPIDDGLGSGLTPAVKLPTYAPNLNSWPTECVESLSKEEYEECSNQTIPIQPGQEHDDGSSNTFVDDYERVYIFSPPAIINQNDEVVDEFIYSKDDVRIYYQDLDFNSGALKGYSLKITIKSDNFETSFFYEDRNNYDLYPRSIGDYEVVATLLNTRYETKTTSTTNFSIIEDDFNPILIDNNLVNHLESMYIYNSQNMIDSFTSSILNGVREGLFFSGEFTSIDDNQSYYKGKYNELSLNEVSIKFSTTINGSYISTINSAGNYYAHIKIEPKGYTSEFIKIPFVITADKIVTDSFKHNNPVIPSNIDFSKEYFVDINNSTLTDNQKLYISFTTFDDQNLGIEFEATEANLANFDLYPKNSGKYKVISTIKNGDIIVSVKSSTFTINSLNTSNPIFNSSFMDDVVEGFSADGSYRIDDDIRSRIQDLLYLNLILDNELLIINDNKLELLTSNDYYKYLSYQLYSSKQYEISEINSSGEYYIKFYLNIPNYNYKQDETLYKFTIKDKPIIENKDIIFLNEDLSEVIDLVFSNKYYFKLDLDEILLNKEIYCITVKIYKDNYEKSFIYDDMELLLLNSGNYNILITINNLINDKEVFDIINKSFEVKKINALLENTFEYVQSEETSYEEIISNFINSSYLSINDTKLTNSFYIVDNELVLIQNTYNITILYDNKVVTELKKSGEYKIVIHFDNENYEVEDIVQTINLELQNNDTIVPIVVFISVLIFILCTVIVIIFRKKR